MTTHKNTDRRTPLKRLFFHMLFWLATWVGLAEQAFRIATFNLVDTTWEYTVSNYIGELRYNLMGYYLPY